MVYHLASDVNRPNSGSLVASGLLHEDRERGLVVEYKIFHVPWDQSDLPFLRPCETGDTSLAENIPELWRFETRVVNVSSTNSIYFKLFPSVPVTYSTGTQLQNLCRNWGTRSQEAFENGTYIRDGDVNDLFFTDCASAK